MKNTGYSLKPITECSLKSENRKIDEICENSVPGTLENRLPYNVRFLKNMKFVKKKKKVEKIFESSENFIPGTFANWLPAIACLLKNKE